MTTRTKNANRRDLLKTSGERRKTKKILRQDQTIQTKQDIPKQRKKFQSLRGFGLLSSSLNNT